MLRMLSNMEGLHYLDWPNPPRVIKWPLFFFVIFLTWPFLSFSSSSAFLQMERVDGGNCGFKVGIRDAFLNGVLHDLFSS
ncbi:hypothetical protein CEXT_813221 [Caerostris extrusa]|uniref:Uncharacterized protein n=1 Tax=Caerostris extrusa TaxID=172846 RepID=A0AAV4TGF7_CAEEX|nr:hypothetical protein CEXT_813221 [Caerostris extrusa]